MRALLVLVMCGCYSPSPQPGAPCNNGRCPSGLVCSPATDTCELTAIDAATRDTIVDAPSEGIVMPDGPATIPVMIQQRSSYDETATSLSATLAQTPMAGRMLIMVGGNIAGSITVSGAAPAWTLATRSLVNTNVEIWFGVADGSSATVSITRNEAANMWMVVSEWSGLAATNTLDVATSRFGINNPVTAGSITTTNARDLLVFAATTRSPNTYGTPSQGPWTGQQTIAGTSVTQSVWYRTVTATGTFTPDVTQSSNEGWEAGIAALRIAP